MINLKNVSFSYDKTPILQDINLIIQPHRIYGIIGPNGCGKTTLLRLMARLLLPTSGVAFLDGENLTHYERKDLAKKVAFLPQNRNVPSMSVQTMVGHGRFPYLGLSRKLTQNDHAKMIDAMKASGVYDMRHRSVGELSGGERQRVYIAMLMAQDTAYALLDEPTTYLDVAHQYSVMDLMKTLKKQGKTVVTVLHDLTLAFSYCDQLIIMNEGKIVWQGAPQMAAQNDIISQVFGVKCQSVLVDGKTHYIVKR